MHLKCTGFANVDRKIARSATMEYRARRINNDTSSTGTIFQLVRASRALLTGRSISRAARHDNDDSSAGTRPRQHAQPQLAIRQCASPAERLRVGGSRHRGAPQNQPAWARELSARVCCLRRRPPAHPPQDVLTSMRASQPLAAPLRSNAESPCAAQAASQGCMHGRQQMHAECVMCVDPPS